MICWAFLGLGVSSSDRFISEALFSWNWTSSLLYPLWTKYVFKLVCGVDNPDLGGKSFLTVRLDCRQCFFYSGVDDSFAVEILMGVCRFCIKICSETSLVVDDSCVTVADLYRAPIEHFM